MPLIRKTQVTSQVSATLPDSISFDPIALLENGNQEERWAAARAAASLTDEAVPLALSKALLSESDPQVREAIFTSLTRMRSLASVNVLMPFLRMDSASLRTGALDALRAMPDLVRDCLPKLLSDPDSDVRLLSCEIARSLPSEEATRLLCNQLAQENELNVCAGAIDVLTEVGTVEALPALKKCEEKFKAMPFMIFAVRIAIDRILTQSNGQSNRKGTEDPSTSPHATHG